MKLPHINGDIARMTDEQLARLDETPPRGHGHGLGIVLALWLAAMFALGGAVAINSAMHWHNAERLERSD